jgi:hypothetical protein
MLPQIVYMSRGGYMCTIMNARLLRVKSATASYEPDSGYDEAGAHLSIFPSLSRAGSQYPRPMGYAMGGLPPLPLPHSTPRRIPRCLLFWQRSSFPLLVRGRPCHPSPSLVASDISPLHLGSWDLSRRGAPPCRRIGGNHFHYLIRENPGPNERE